MMTYPVFDKLTSMFRMITLVPFVYKKFLPFGSPPSTIGIPRVVRGNVAKVTSEI